MKRIATLILVMLSLLPLCGQVDIENGLTAYYPFNGNAHNKNGNLYHGIVSGATLGKDQFGNENAAYYFDGIDDYIKINYNAILEPSIFTISVWVKVQKTNRDYATIISSDPDGAQCKHGYGMSYFRSGALSFNVDPSSQCKDHTNIKTPYNICDGLWHHIVGIYDGKVLLYIDGNLVGVTSNSPYPKTNGDIYIGKGLISRGEKSNIHGFIDELRMYNRALNPLEIKQLYAYKINGPFLEKDTIDYYVSNADFENISPKVYLERIDSFVSNRNKYDSIIHYYSRYVYQPTYCTDTLVIQVYNKVSVTDTLIIDVIISALNTPDYNSTLKIYPNPAKDILILNTGSHYKKLSGYRFNIVNSLGITVFESNITAQEMKINLNSFGDEGLFFFRVLNDKNQTIVVSKILLR